MEEVRLLASRVQMEEIPFWSSAETDEHPDAALIEKLRFATVSRIGRSGSSDLRQFYEFEQSERYFIA